NLDFSFIPCPLLKPHGYLVGAVLRSRFAHLICERGLALLARVIGVAAWHIGYCRNDYAVAVNVDTGRSRPAPGEIYCVESMHLPPRSRERDLTRRRSRRCSCCSGRSWARSYSCCRR